MPKAKKPNENVCDKNCIGCIYVKGYSLGFLCCGYMMDTNKRRPCPAGAGCTVKITRKRRKLK